MTETNAIEQARREYLENRILMAEPVELVQMLYQLAISKVQLAITHLKQGDTTRRSRAVSKAQMAVVELTLALDHSVDAAFSHRLAGLYAYIQSQISKGHTEKSEPAFREAVAILTTLWEGWAQVRPNIAENGSAPAASDEIPASAGDFSDPYSAYSRSSEVPAQSRDWSC